MSTFFQILIEVTWIHYFLTNSSSWGLPKSFLHCLAGQNFREIILLWLNTIGQLLTHEGGPSASAYPPSTHVASLFFVTVLPKAVKILRMWSGARVLRTNMELQICLRELSPVPVTQQTWGQNPLYLLSLPRVGMGNDLFSIHMTRIISATKKVVSFFSLLLRH